MNNQVLNPGPGFVIINLILYKTHTLSGPETDFWVVSKSFMLIFFDWVNYSIQVFGWAGNNFLCNFLQTPQTSPFPAASVLSWPLLFPRGSPTPIPSLEMLPHVSWSRVSVGDVPIILIFFRRALFLKNELRSLVSRLSSANIYCVPARHQTAQWMQ